jgi:chloramphenicol 3-O phosphotransferase
MTPARCQPGIGLRPGGDRPDLEPVIQQLYASVFEAIAAVSRQGISVVSDFGIHDGYSRPLGIWAEMERRLAGLPVLRVGVFCAIDVIMARRNAEPRDGFYAAGEGVPEPVARWQAAVHLGKRYDLTVDTGQMSPAECAAAIFEHVASGAANSGSSE